MTTQSKPVVGRPAGQLKQAHQHWERGVSLAERGDWGQAVVSFRKATQAAPLDPLYRLNLARALLHADQVEQCITEAERVLKIDPDNALVRQFLAERYVSKGRMADAIACLQALPEDVPVGVDYLEALGGDLFAAQRYEEAIAVYFRLLALKVDHANAHYQLGLCFHSLGMKKEMVECLLTAVALDIEGGMLGSRTLLAFVDRELCRWDRSEPEIAAMNALIDALPDRVGVWSSVFSVVTLTDDPARHLKVARACAWHFTSLVKPLPAITRRPIPARLRLGFVSADFHQHATTILMAELLEKMNRQHFEVFLYSHGPDDGSEMRHRIQDTADHFVEVGPMTDREAAQRIRRDQIDVLIDLKGHTAKCRLGIFAQRPAPIQASYLGFPGTTGADYIDYFIGDGVVSPLSEAAHYSEKLALMPVCYQPNDQQRPLPAPTTRAQHGLPADALVLCGFNQPFKLSPEVFDVWCDLLHRLPSAVLWLLKWNDDSVAPLRQEAERRGIRPERLVFAPAVKSAQHLSRFALADIYLDSWPCNGHTTVSDALWAGVPVVTYQGRSFPSRVASSLLQAVGLGEWVTHDVASYRDQVLALAHDPARRDAVRTHLHAARSQAPLFDSDRYARDFSALIHRMAARYSQGLPPDHLPALPT